MWSKLKAGLLLAGPAGAPGQLFLCHGDLLPKQENGLSGTLFGPAALSNALMQ